MISAITQFADSSSGIGALGINGTALLIQVVTFLLAFWVLQRFAFKPIIRIMDRRRDTIEKGVKLGEEMQREKAELEKTVEQSLQSARQQADGIIADAKSQARQIVLAAEDEAKTKAEFVLSSADERVKRDTIRARKQLEHDIVELISDATEAIIDEKVDAQKDAALIDKAMRKQEVS